MSKFNETNALPTLIHVGFPKCLSSWMQKHLFKAEQGYLKIMDPVAVQLGIIDPQPFHFNASAVQQQLEEQTTGIDPQLVPVITSEALSGNMYAGGYNGKELIDRVHQVCPNGKILLLVREQKALIRSLYKSLVVWGMPHSIDRLLNPVQPRLTPQFNLEFFCFDQRLAYYQQLFGKDRVKVLAYENFLLTPHKFLREIHEFSENRTEFKNVVTKLPVKQTVNSGQTLFNIEIERLRNRFFVSGPFNYNALFTDTDEQWEKRVRRSKTNKLPGFLDKAFEESFQQKVLIATQGKFAASNQKLSELTGLDLKSLGYEV